MPCTGVQGNERSIFICPLPLSSIPRRKRRSCLLYTSEMFGTAAGKCVPLAMSMAGIQHDDIDVMEMYDCFSITVLREIEDCGFCGIGEGIDFIGDGSVLSLEGKFPLNTHGGQLSRCLLYTSNHLSCFVESEIRVWTDDDQAGYLKAGQMFAAVFT